MRTREYRYFVADFETTVYKGQVATEVWASASVELFEDDNSVQIFNNIDEQIDYYISLKSNLIIYYHNIKFDGSFLISNFLVKRNYKQALEFDEKDINNTRFKPIKNMGSKTFSYSISNMGQWYRITLKIGDYIIEFRDSLKLLPFSLDRIGKAFKTNHRKTTINYTGFRYAGGVITEDEKTYIKNDVLVLKEAMEILFKEGNTKLTIGSCCLAEYKKSIGGATYERLFPNMYELSLNEKIYGEKTVGDYIRKSYKGGWVYVVKGKQGKIINNGFTADANSLYPSQMHSDSGNRYPIGLPEFWKGDFIPDIALRETRYFFIRIRTRFYLKEKYLPFIQMKGNLMYKGTEMLETSDIYNHKDKKYYSQYIDFDGNIQDATVELTLTMTDYELFLEHYNVEDFEILDGCHFKTAIGIFDNYIEKYKEIKINSTGAKRELAKLYLNNLYGKMASSKDSSFKVAYLKEDNSIGYYTVIAQEKQPGYIPVGSAIVSYARCHTVQVAQQNYHGADKQGFIYADTDSIHCDMPIEQLKGVELHEANFNAWKVEGTWDIAKFLRAKRYIEHYVTDEHGEKIEPYYLLKCAGMSERCKKLFLMTMGEYTPKDGDNLEQKYLSDSEIDFLQKKHSIDDFAYGLLVPGKLTPKNIPGGILLTETTFQMR